MDLKKILAKVVNGEELTEAEKDYLDKFDPDKNGKIPIDRLNKEIGKKEKAMETAEALQEELDELKKKFEKLEAGDLSEAEKLQKTIDKLQEQVDTLTTERDDARSETNSMKFDTAVQKLAAEHGFTDSSYLGYLVKQNSDLKLDDADAVKTVVDGLRESSPKLFKVDANPGGGSNPKVPGDGKKADESRYNELMGKETLTKAEENELSELGIKLDEAGQEGK